jgi:type III secretory pathway lipoprotein EscJ
MAAGMGLEAVRSNVTTSVQRMSGAQRVTLGLAFAATAIGLFLVTRVTGRTPMSTLYADLEPEVAAEIVDQLEAQEVHYELASGGRVILVPSDQVHALRLELSAQGLPASGEGWSVLDDQGITTSEFDQRVGYQRAMEGELAKTIAAIEGVSDANVHLVMPEDDLFVDDDVQASASVLLVTGGPGSISPMQVEAIVNLVASSVEGMTPDRVSVTDQNGQILAAPGEGRGVNKLLRIVPSPTATRHRNRDEQTGHDAADQHTAKRLRTKDHTHQNRRHHRYQAGDHHLLNGRLGHDIDTGAVFRLPRTFHDALDLPKLPSHLFHNQATRFSNGPHTEGPKDEGQHAAEE